ncbi:hypothetical protein Mpal_1463 [Methanosphaerula palustris E1-9c]|uniref:Uncharacterized protein n=1 Tax=Methanosphaerula palustris (strain ATCC BAA-1556 / DSM 19958 / E1-9c) TaxID=521011 RepID=B8GI46_METPE|nr:hypothetical protein Mpal_1463 [Methanosphaerula palustris E1-9c]
MNRKPVIPAYLMDCLLATTGQENPSAAGKPTERRSIRTADYKKHEIPESRSIVAAAAGMAAGLSRN